MFDMIRPCDICGEWHTKHLQTCTEAAFAREKSIVTCPHCLQSFVGETKFVTANLKVHHQAAHASFTENSSFRVPREGEDAEC